MFDASLGSSKTAIEVSADMSGVVLPYPLVFEKQGRGRDVERINPFSFYRLATRLSKLSAYRGDTPPSDIIVAFWTAEAAVKMLLRDDPIPLGVSRAAVNALKKLIDDMTAEYFKDDPFPSEDAPNIIGRRFENWRNLVETFETVFSAEMAETTSYYIPKRGIYDTAALIDHADDSFPQDVLPFVAEKTREDWRAAGRCLALNLFTASGFHVVRAVEGTLETYYQTFTGQPGVTKLGWNGYLKELEALPEGTTPMPDPKTLAVIRQMKDDYRNPVVHPRVVLTEADAHMLFNNGVSAIIGMAQGLKDAAPGE